MFQAFKKVFGFGKSQLKPQGDYWITQPEQICELLTQSLQDLILFSATIDPHPDTFQTALVKLRPEQGFLIIDELIPREGHELLLENKAITLFGRLDGASIRFEARLIKAEEESGIPCYKMQIPDSIYFHQRRKFDRLKIHPDEVPFRAFGGTVSYESLLGYAYDISPVGIGVILRRPVALLRGDFLSDCTINLPNEGRITFSLDVCIAVSNREQGITRLGGQLQKITSLDSCKIRNFLDQLEREKVKRSNRL